MLSKMLLISAAVLIGAAAGAADEIRSGIVHGPKGAFTINAPAGWVIDNEAGADDGLPCVLYQKGTSWENADPLMYAKIASPSFENAEAFAKTAIAEMKKQRGEYATKRVAAGKTKSGSEWFINEYSPNETYPRLERVAYIQMPKAVAYVVFSADSEQAFRRHEAALQQVVDSFTALKMKPAG